MFQLILVLCAVSTIAQTRQREKYFVSRNQLEFNHEGLTDAEFLKYGVLSDVKQLQEATTKIGVPRVVGSEGHRQVREHIVNFLQDLHWSVDVQQFSAKTPLFGTLDFHNIIAKLNPNAERYLMLACHYDSKYFENFEFIGATDSAVPCALLLNLAYVLQDALRSITKKHISLLLVFFDGEEAFKHWSGNDSLYGAKHMSKHWHRTGFLECIDIMMLLDLLGMPDPKFYSFFANTENWYARLLDIEERLADMGLLVQYANSGVTPYTKNQYFQPETTLSSYVEDDHVPFMKLGVPIIHVIPMPFPDVWHTAGDNLTVIDYVTTENIARIIRLFTMEYLKGDTY